MFGKTFTQEEKFYNYGFKLVLSCYFYDVCLIYCFLSFTQYLAHSRVEKEGSKELVKLEPLRCSLRHFHCHFPPNS